MIKRNYILRFDVKRSEKYVEIDVGIRGMFRGKVILVLSRFSELFVMLL